MKNGDANNEIILWKINYFDRQYGASDKTKSLTHKFACTHTHK